MDQQHPIPRQITTFEFKLIGFLTLKQFIYLVIFAALGFVFYGIFPIPFLNILLGIIIGSIGLAFAFIPVNDRPLDSWINNLIRRLTSPTQYFYHKQNQPLYFLSELYFDSDPHRIMAHIDSQEKLNSYLLSRQQKQTPVNNKQLINNLIQKIPIPASKPKPEVSQVAPVVSSPKTPFFSGIIKNNKLLPLPGILIYVKDANNQTIRLLKTNPHGIFATFKPLQGADYFFEIKDPNSSYFFDKIKIYIGEANQKPIEIFSKEML